MIQGWASWVIAYCLQVESFGPGKSAARSERSRLFSVANFLASGLDHRITRRPWGNIADSK